MNALMSRPSTSLLDQGRTRGCPAAQTSLRSLRKLDCVPGMTKRQDASEYFCVLPSVAVLPLCQRKDVGHLTAFVRPGIDRPQLAALAVPDHRRVVRTLREQEPRRRRGDRMVSQQFDLVENEQQRIGVV